MIRVLELILAVIITIVFFVVIALFLPSSAHVEREVELSNPMIQVYDSLNHFKRYNAWNPWYQFDPRATYTLEGAEYGEGAGIAWNSQLDKTVGQGKLTIRESLPDERIVMDIENNWRGHNKTYTFSFAQSPQTNAVTLKWELDVDYGWDLLGRYSGMYLNGRVGELMNEGLGKMASILATVPNYDYSQVEIQVQDVQPVVQFYETLVVPAAPVKWDEAEAILNKGWEEVEAFVATNNIPVAGQRRRIVSVLGEEEHEYNVAIPVALDPLQPAPAVPPANIRFGQSYGGRVLTVQHRGHRVGLTKPRDMLKAYAMTHGYAFNRDMTGSWEEWLPQEEAPEGALYTPELITTVYLPIQ